MLGIQASFFIPILEIPVLPNTNAARLDTKWTYRWTQKEKSYTEKYIIIM